MRAMILAAGLGTRMRPLTDHTPKPMLKAGGRPLIEHQVIRLAAAGFQHIVINHAYLGEKIERYLGNGQSYGCAISYSHEREPLETGGGIFKALDKLSENAEPFLVVNGDVWIDYDYRQLIDIDLGRNLAHLVMVKNPEHHQKGDFVLENGMLGQTNNNESNINQNTTTFSGLSILSPKLFVTCSPGAFRLAPLLLEAMKNQKVSGEKYLGYWLDVGTPERLQSLHDYLECSTK